MLCWTPLAFDLLSKKVGSGCLCFPEVHPGHCKSGLLRLSFVTLVGDEVSRNAQFTGVAVFGLQTLAFCTAQNHSTLCFPQLCHFWIGNGCCLAAENISFAVKPLG